MIFAFLLAHLSAAALGAKPATSQQPWGLKIVEFARCPLPASESIMTLEPDGGATLSAHGGFEPGEGDSTRQKKQFTQKEMRKLARIVRRAKLESIPDKVYDLMKPPPKTDGCSQSIEIDLNGKKKRIEYNSGYDYPPRLEKLLKDIHAVLDRREWVEDKLFPTTPR